MSSRFKPVEMTEKPALDTVLGGKGYKKLKSLSGQPKTNLFTVLKREGVWVVLVATTSGLLWSQEFSFNYGTAQKIMVEVSTMAIAKSGVQIKYTNKIPSA
jgi:hypothetical protein